MNSTGKTPLFFDFDGVLTDSTATKTNSYKEIFKSYGSAIVAQIVAHHQQHAGISRVDKIEYAHRHILDSPYSKELVAEHVNAYSQMVFEKVIQADWIPGAEKFVASHYKQMPLFIISGTPQDELTEIVNRRGMNHYFREVLGSPSKKPFHIRSLVKRYDLNIEDCFFIGDALTDYYAAQETGMPFIGIHSEVDFPEGTVVLPDCRDLEETIQRLKH